MRGVDDLGVVSFDTFREKRGVLVPVELAKSVPFPVKRIFWIFDVPVGGMRADHAHKICQQFMICAAGALRLETFDGERERTLALEAGQGLHVPALMFVTAWFERPGSVLMVLCDQSYDPGDYIFDRAALTMFRRAVRR